MKGKNEFLKDEIIFIDENKNQSVLYKMDEGLQFGLGFFETILIRDKVYFLEEHLHRLNKSLETFGFGFYVSFEAVEKLIQTYFLKNIALKIIATEKNLFAMTRPISYNLETYQMGKKVTISNVIKSSHSGLLVHKSLNYGENILELRKAKESGFDDCLFLNENGHITESAIANLFIIHKDKLITPPLSDGLLPGIIRQKIIENFTVYEDHITKDQLKSCQGAFLTNSLLGVVNISHVEDIKLASHPLSHDVARFFEEMIPQNEKYR